jgi:hypothetical protein
MSKRTFPRPLEEMRRRYPIHGRLEGWFFRMKEISAGVYQVQGSDPWGRKVSRTGSDAEALLDACVEDAIWINAKL